MRRRPDLTGTKNLAKTQKAILVGLLAILVIVIPGHNPVFGQGGSWTIKASMPTGRFGVAVGVVNGILYVVGGAANGVILSTVEAYNPSTDTWTTMASMPTSRYAAGAGVVDGILYVVGGFSASDQALATVEAYNPSTNTWSMRAAMPTPRYGLGVGVLNEILYAFGGFDLRKQTFFATVEAYDPQSDTWTTKASMSTPRFLPGSGVVDRTLYAVGGLNVSSVLTTAEAYNPRTNTWITKSPMPTGRWGLGVGVANRLLFAVGGLDARSSILRTVEAYDPESNTWTTGLPPMPTARIGLGVGAANRLLYAVGGLGTRYLATNEAFKAPLPFAAFSAKIDIDLDARAFDIKSTFSLDEDRKGISPLTEAVTINVGAFSITIPAGSFKLDSHGKSNRGKFVFAGVVNRVAIEASLTPRGENAYSFELEGVGAHMLPNSNPVAVSLIIGDDLGSATVKARFE